jgi:hypothetical protein
MEIMGKQFLKVASFSTLERTCGSLTAPYFCNWIGTLKADYIQAWIKTPSKTLGLALSLEMS